MRTKRAVIIVAVTWVSCVLAGCPSQSVSPQAAPPSGSHQTAQQNEWRLPPGTIVSPTGSFDISADRKWAVVMGDYGDPAICYAWKLDLQTGKVSKLPGNPEAGNQKASQGADSAELSPDGKRVLWQRSGHDGQAGVGDLATGSFVRIPKSDEGRLLWSGNKILLCESEEPIKAFDADGKALEGIKIRAQVLRAERTGKRLLAWVTAVDPKTPGAEAARIMAVITLEGKVLRKIGSEGICPWGPWFSRQGGYSAIYYSDPKIGEWVTRLFSTETPGEITLTPYGYGGVLAITDTGEGIKLDEPDGAARLDYWNRDGVCRKLAEHVVVGTILGKEIFYIQRGGPDDKSLVLKAAAFPKAAPEAATAPSKGVSR